MIDTKKLGVQKRNEIILNFSQFYPSPYKYMPELYQKSEHLHELWWYRKIETLGPSPHLKRFHHFFMQKHQILSRFFSKKILIFKTMVKKLESNYILLESGFHRFLNLMKKEPMKAIWFVATASLLHLFRHRCISFISFTLLLRLTCGPTFMSIPFLTSNLQQVFLFFVMEKI